MQAILEHFARTKTQYGAFLALVGGWLQVSFPQYNVWAQLLTLVGTFLAGGGLMKSDRETKRDQ